MMHASTKIRVKEDGHFNPDAIIVKDVKLVTPEQLQELGAQKTET